MRRDPRAYLWLLIHGYALVDDAIVWEAVTTELPALRERLDELLTED
jgi:uncharacterized protein with HEPN domain